ncbi:uncharacterized protein [Glycine max]|uniref:uncharacterized protein n=1 Tax=Glycine max TaxID=3847 RepID=UPI00071941FB|nr:uncharacterized protein LOC106795434 [Glycine max]|eukprot:XP_014620523.1 uncharacterized protein LOC106795434 isoform X2 [Glycine max]
MALEEGKVKIEKFEGRDFSFWKMQIEDYLYQKKLYQPLSGVKPDDMKQEEWNLLDRKALGMIRLTLTKNVTFNIVNEKTTAGLMKALPDMYEKPLATNKVYLMRRLFNLKMGEVSSSTRENTLKLSDIRDLILSEDVCKRDSRESSSHVSNSALNTEGKGRTIQKGQNGRGRSKSREKGQRKFQSDITCWNYDKKCHFSNQCNTPKKNK